MRTSATIAKAIMWVAWLLCALTSVLMAIYLTRGLPKLNSFGRPFDVFAIGIFLFPLLLCGGLRLWVSCIRNPWLALLPYLIGVFFAWQAGCYGIFLLPEFLILFQILSASLFLAYLPIFVRVNRL